MRKVRREAPYHQTDADQRYGDLLDLLSHLLDGEDRQLAWELVCELDDAVGKRLCEAEDRAAPRCARSRR